MILLETEQVVLKKLRTFLKALDALGDAENAEIRVDDTDGNVTITLSVGNNHSCLALKRKPQT